MRKSCDQRIVRILDANVNRAREGLRVCEDICRFYLDKKSLTRGYKDVRHGLTAVFLKTPVAGLLKARRVADDVGRPSTASEFARKDISGVFYANSQRVKESLRVLEELMKLNHRKAAETLKQLRYRIYVLEKKAGEAF